ncbi:MAG: FkbM family methyltransferase [Magnetococcales bacterium]|nr:FkbM family methyltransferase [Magnetococcales bacterium]
MTIEKRPTSTWETWRLIYRAWRFRLGRDKYEILTLLDHLKPGQTAIDIGAHKGAYTYWMQKRVGPTGRVFAFEPQPVLAARLRGLVAKMAMSQVQVEQMGLSDQEAVGVLTVPGDGSASPGASLVGQSIQGPKTAIPGIKLVSLDHYFAEQSPVHLIKCDVEGHELAVFKGGRNLLERDRPLILFECEARHQSGQTMEEVFRFLTDLGYVGSFYHHGEKKPLVSFSLDMQADVSCRNYMNNFIFIHPDAAKHS